MAVHVLARYLTVLLASIYIGRDFALHVEINPESFVTWEDSDVTISCVPDEDSLISEIVLMEMHKDDEQKPLVVIHRQKNAALNKDLNASRYLVNGRINDDDVSRSYLNLTLLDPDVKDTGVYTCVLYYLDENQLFGQQRESKNFTALNIDSATLEQYLSKKLAEWEESLLKLLEKSGGKESDPKLAKRVGVLEKKAKEHDDTINELSDKDKTIITRVGGLESGARNQTQTIEDLREKVSYTTAFSVTNNHTHVTTSNGDVLILPDVIMRQGQGYDEKTGIFTVPRDGLYAFHVVVFANSGCDLDLNLRANDKVMARLQAYDSKHYDQSSISSVMNLAVGDKVVCIMKDNGCRLINGQYTVFTGYLVRSY